MMNSKYSKLKNKWLRLRGFTLLEMLVVLVLVAFVSTLILQGFSFIFQLRSRFLVQLDDLQRGAIQEHWFRSSTAAIVTDYRDGEHIFKGEEREFSGLTLVALDAMMGAPTAFAWQLKYTGGSMVLRYQNSKGEYWEVARWLGEEGYFRYMAKDGEWHSQWPPKFGLISAQIPRAIFLSGRRRQTPLTWIVKLTDYDTTRYDSRLDF